MSRLGQQDVGHEGVITGSDAFSLRSSIANPQGVAQSSLQSTNCTNSFIDKLKRLGYKYIFKAKLKNFTLEKREKSTFL
ncbi:hypothetical protein [Lysinibacillus sp. RC79]|uniref:hypothetical protein n=1 Tax=Lysinibacillus sp. RC79 TaxID=3156296 RepID=UPI0035145313